MTEDPDPALADPALADPFLGDRAEEDAALAVEVVRASRGPRWQWPSALVIGGMVVALAIVASDHFRRGAVLFAGIVLLAFFLRLILRDEDAGWLAVRSRGVDLACLGVLATSLSIFALIVPPPS